MVGPAYTPEFQERLGKLWFGEDRYGVIPKTYNALVGKRIITEMRRHGNELKLEQAELISAALDLLEDMKTSKSYQSLSSFEGIYKKFMDQVADYDLALIGMKKAFEGSPDHKNVLILIRDHHQLKKELKTVRVQLTDKHFGGWICGWHRPQVARRGGFSRARSQAILNTDNPMATGSSSRGEPIEQRNVSEGVQEKTPRVDSLVLGILDFQRRYRFTIALFTFLISLIISLFYMMY